MINYAGIIGGGFRGFSIQEKKTLTADTVNCLFFGRFRPADEQHTHLIHTFPASKESQHCVHTGRCSISSSAPSVATQDALRHSIEVHDLASDLSPNTQSLLLTRAKLKKTDVRRKNTLQSAKT